MDPATIEHIRCGCCLKRDHGTGRDLTRRGWRSCEILGYTHFYCGACLFGDPIRLVVERTSAPAPIVPLPVVPDELIDSSEVGGLAA